VVFAQFAKNLGSLVEAVNLVGSYFYPVLLGVFVLAFFFPRVKGSAAFWAILTGEAGIVACAVLTKIAFLWYNVVGSLIVVVFGLLYSTINRSSGISLTVVSRCDAGGSDTDSVDR